MNGIEGSQTPTSRTTSQATSKTYAQTVVRHAQKTHHTSLSPGQNFQRLAEFLWRPYTTPLLTNTRAPTQASVIVNGAGGLPNAPVDPDDTEREVFLTLYHYGRSTDGQPTKVPRSVDFAPTQKGRESFQNHCAVLGPGGSQLLFIRGFASPKWLNLIGLTYRVDPEYFRRHLSFMQTYDQFDLPSLPCISTNLVSLPLVTNGMRIEGASDSMIGGSDLTGDRRNAQQQTSRYLRQVEGSTGCGQSIVRKLQIHNEKRFSIEQQLSISICHKSDGWTAVVWLDCGLQDLNTYLEDSLKSMQTSSKFVRYDLLPVFQYREKLAMSGDDINRGRLPPDPLATNRTNSQRGQRTLAQSAKLLASMYGRHLDPAVVRVDALYAVSELFAFSAFSQNQLLNLVAAVIESERSPPAAKMQASLANLQACKTMLEDQIQKQESSLSSIRSHGGPQWPRAVEPEHVAIAAAQEQTLLSDFDYLLGRSRMLRSQCVDLTNLLMNQAMLAEAQRGILQAEALGRLTLLAFLFVPLSFTTSFFGMNLTELQHEDGPAVSLYVWFVVSVPIFLASLTFLFWGRITDYLAQNGMYSS